MKKANKHVVLAREQALNNLIKAGVEVPEGLQFAKERVLNFLEDMDSGVSFMTNWKMGTVLGLNPDQRINRWAVTILISERADHDAEFRQALLQNPRYLIAIAANESCGLKPIDFLWQVNSVIVVQEEPGLHWLILPACQLGCGTPEGQELPSATGSCSVCGKPQGTAGNCQQEITSAEKMPVDIIHEIDEFIVRSVAGDGDSYTRLMSDPTKFYFQASQALFGVLPDDKFGIKEVKVVADTDTTLYLVLLAKHKTISPTIANNKKTAMKKNQNGMLL
jgi:hypothetical protein